MDSEDSSQPPPNSSKKKKITGSFQKSCFTDVFIERPVLSIVLMLLILVLGLRSLEHLPIRQYPFTRNAVIRVDTSYSGADPEIVSGFITTPLESYVSQANGIDYMISYSTPGSSSIQAFLRLNYDPNRALTEVNTLVNSVVNDLPAGCDQPNISLSMKSETDVLYIGFYSDVMDTNQIEDYLIRVVQPKLQSVQNVQLAEVKGSAGFALRAWLDPLKMTSFGVTAEDVSSAIAQNNFTAAVGRTDGSVVTVNLVADTGLHSVEEFQNLIVKSKKNVIIRLKDVAKVALGSQSPDYFVQLNGKNAVYIGIKPVPGSNVLSVVKDIKQLLPGIFQYLPNGVKGEIVYDNTIFITKSVEGVIHALWEASIIVTLVIFLFLGTLRSVLIPVVTIPLSLIGTFFIMFLLGFTINLLTLLAFVLAIGLVVDDAIIVVENVHRYMGKGMSVWESSLKGARELSYPIVVIGIVLISVYIPIAFLGGLTGALFTEFSFTLASAVGISAFISLTFSPLMCARLLGTQSQKKSFVSFGEHLFLRVQFLYEKFLVSSLNYIPVTLVLIGIIFLGNYGLYVTSKQELAPQEDEGFIRLYLRAPSNINIYETGRYAGEMFKILEAVPEKKDVLQYVGVDGLNTIWTIVALKDWAERQETATQVQNKVQKEVSKIPGPQIDVYQPSSLPGSGGGYPVQFVIQTSEPFDKLNEVSQRFLEKAKSKGVFSHLDTDLKIDKEQVILNIDRSKAANLGISMEQVGNVLSSALSNGSIDHFSLKGRSYKIIPQILRKDRLNPSDLEHIYLKTQTEKTISLSSFISFKPKVIPESINHFQQLNAATISGSPIPGVSVGEALHVLKEVAKEMLPSGYSVDYSGTSRQQEQEGSALLSTFFFALVIIYLALAALFESFRDPFIVLISVPMSIFGALIFINLGVGGATLNIYTQVGLLTLIGLISKHGILIVQFANDFQEKGHFKKEAIIMASKTRLRPILMTTAAMVLGVVPLLLAHGAGAESRFNIGLVIASGVSVGTFFTLFVVPAMYMAFAKERRKISSKFPQA